MTIYKLPQKFEVAFGNNRRTGYGVHELFFFNTANPINFFKFLFYLFFNYIVISFYTFNHFRLGGLINASEQQSIKG